MTKTVTLPKTEYDLMETELEEWREEHEEKLRDATAECISEATDTVRKLGNQLIMAKRSRKIVPIFFDSQKRADRFVRQNGEDFLDTHASETAYALNSKAYYRLCKLNQELTYQNARQAAILSVKERYGEALRGSNLSLQAQNKILTESNKLNKGLSIFFGCVSVATFLLFTTGIL